jgi:hypothetical protein
LVASLYHYGAFSDHDVVQTTAALMGYGVGLLGLVAIKVLAPGFYASQDIKTPVRVALGVLALTQLLNLVLVPMFSHAGLALGRLRECLLVVVGLASAWPLPTRPGMGSIGPASGVGLRGAGAGVELGRPAPGLVGFATHAWAALGLVGAGVGGLGAGVFQRVAPGRFEMACADAHLTA